MELDEILQKSYYTNRSKRVEFPVPNILTNSRSYFFNLKKYNIYVHKVFLIQEIIVFLRMLAICDAYNIIITNKYLK